MDPDQLALHQFCNSVDPDQRALHQFCKSYCLVIGSYLVSSISHIRAGIKSRVRNRKIIFLFLNQNICCRDLKSTVSMRQFF